MWNKKGWIMYNIDEYLNNEEELDNNPSSFLCEWKELPLTKIEKLVNFISVLEGQNATIKNEIDRMSDLKKGNEKKIENIKNYLLTLIDDKPLNIGTHRLSKRHSQAVEIIDETKVPDEFKEQRITYTISKAKIKDFLNKDLIDNETGEVIKTECDFACLKNNVSLIIK